jgi:ribosomal protein S18 acetylase RimI-like enzyme
MDVTIRKATAQDYAGLCEIIEEVDALHGDHLPHIFQKPKGPARELEWVLGLLSDPDHGLFVAEVEGQLAGFVHLVIRDSHPIPLLVPRRLALVDNLAVKTEFRRSGIGRALMQRAEAWAAAKSATEIDLNVYEFNETAIAFYQNLGYETYSRRMSKPLLFGSPGGAR